MRYIGIFKVKTDDNSKMVAKYRAVQEERKLFPDRYPKPLKLEDGSIARGRISLNKGIYLYDGTPEQTINLAVRYHPEMEIKFIPCLNPVKIREAFEKLE
jgi:hypothetical protein